MKKYRILFMGTPTFAAVQLQALLAHPTYEVVAVFAQPDRPQGRGQKIQSPPVAEVAKLNSIPLFQPERLNTPENLSIIRNYEVDAMVVSAYGKILRPDFLSQPRVGAINVHGSILPAYRGAAPIQHSLMNGDLETGVALMKMDAGMDTGPVYVDQKIEISLLDTTDTLTQKLARLGAQLLENHLTDILDGKLLAKPQPEIGISYAPKITKDMGVLDWSMPAQSLFCRIRALSDWPTCETTLNGERLKIYRAKVLNESSRGAPGFCQHISHDGWTVATGTGSLLLEEVQLSGKKRMSAFDLANGLRLKSGFQLGVA